MARAGSRIARSEANLSARKLDLPGECDVAIGALERLKTPWAKKLTARVAKACYFDLGSRILEAEVDEMSFCKPTVRQVYRAITEYGFRGDPEVDALVDRAAAKCAPGDVQEASPIP